MACILKHEMDLQSYKVIVKMITEVINDYKWLLDQFVVDFFVENHWDRVPKTWQICFQDMDPQDLSLLLSRQASKIIVPLSFLALIKTVQALSFSRQNGRKKDITSINDSAVSHHPKLKNFFMKHVKLKKRHEVPLMAAFVSNIAKRINCKSVIDFGSGLGHLIRVLSYQNGFCTAGIECQTKLITEARKMDSELEYTVKKHVAQFQTDKFERPTHINMQLSSLQQLRDLRLPENMVDYGLIGLHPCGDLGPLLIRHFVSDNTVKFISLVGCCYMKLTCDEAHGGYPMSEHVKSLKCSLSYASRELACHALEVYLDRLAKGAYEDLMVHAYRAALEKALVEVDPCLRHSLIRSVKHSNSMSFERYCELALSRINVAISEEGMARAKCLIPEWRRVVVLYTLRLVLAPLVETLILLDRMLFIMEHGIECGIEPVFDPKISPRNHIMYARRQH